MLYFTLGIITFMVGFTLFMIAAVYNRGKSKKGIPSTAWLCFIAIISLSLFGLSYANMSHFKASAAKNAYKGTRAASAYKLTYNGSKYLVIVRQDGSKMLWAKVDGRYQPSYAKVKRLNKRIKRLKGELKAIREFDKRMKRSKP